MRLLDGLNRPSMIIGGVAVVAHGFSRFTADIDATVALEPSDVPRLIRAAARQGLRPRIAGAAGFARQNLVLLLEHAPSGTPVDLSLALQAFEIEAARSALTLDFGGVAIRVPSLTALLIYKVLAGRPQDLKDVKALLSSGTPFDEAEINRVLSEFDAILELDRRGDFRALMTAHAAR